MTIRRRIALFDGVHGGEHEALEQLLDVFVQPAVLDGDRRLAGECRHQLDGALRVGDDQPVDVGGGGENRVEDALAVDQLQDADDFVLVILHGNHEHRLGAIPVALVEGPVDRVLDVRRQEVRVVDHERVARDRAVTGEARAIHRNREFHEWRFGLREGLGEPEPEALRSLLVELDEIQAAGVRLGDAPRLGQNQLEQRFDVAFGAERHADPRQLADLPGPLRGLAPRPRRFRARGGFAEAGANGDQQPPRARRVGHNRAARVHKCPHDIDGKEGATLRVEQQDGGAVVHDGHLPGLSDRPGLHLRRLERRRHGVRTPHRRMEQDVSHALAPTDPAWTVSRGGRGLIGFVRTAAPAAGHPWPQRIRGRSRSRG